MPISDLDELLRAMSPRLNEGVYAFLSVGRGINIASLRPIATIVEDEGTSIIVEESHVEGTSLEVLLRAAWITLTVDSDLNAVGLTAAVATVLADKGISCNVVAGTKHDHLFIPVEMASEAMAALLELQLKGASTQIW
jgi:hypothetical protein